MMLAEPFVNAYVNPNMANGLVHHNQLVEAAVVFRGIRSDFQFLLHFFH